MREIMKKITDTRVIAITKNELILEMLLVVFSSFPSPVEFSISVSMGK